MKRLGTWVIVLGLASTAAFAGDRALSARAAAERRDVFAARLAEAVSMAARNPELFAAGPKVAGDGSLKALVQEIATREGLQIAFLSEGEKEAGKGRRERQVSARLVRSAHGKLVVFLAEVERRGGGAVVKELHLRPSKETTDVYEDAELIVARAMEAKR